MPSRGMSNNDSDGGDSSDDELLAGAGPAQRGERGTKGAKGVRGEQGCLYV